MENILKINLGNNINKSAEISNEEELKAEINVQPEVKDEASQAAAGTCLLDAETGITYTIKEINTDDEDMNAFLFRLGCYSGEPITVISKKKKSCIVVIKDGRYNLDNLLAEAIIVE